MAMNNENSNASLRSLLLASSLATAVCISAVAVAQPNWGGGASVGGGGTKPGGACSDTARVYVELGTTCLGDVSDISFEQPGAERHTGSAGERLGLTTAGEVMIDFRGGIPSALHDWAKNAMSGHSQEMTIVHWNATHTAGFQEKFNDAFVKSISDKAMDAVRPELQLDIVYKSMTETALGSETSHAGMTNAWMTKPVGSK